MKAGNNLWWDQIDYYQSLHAGVTGPQAEKEVFKMVCTRMIQEGMSQEDIRTMFKDTFNIGYSAFYNRWNNAEGICHRIKS